MTGGKEIYGLRWPRSDNGEKGRLGGPLTTNRVYRSSQKGKMKRKNEKWGYLQEKKSDQKRNCGKKKGERQTKKDESGGGWKSYKGLGSKKGGGRKKGGWKKRKKQENRGNWERPPNNRGGKGESLARRIEKRESVTETLCSQVGQKDVRRKGRTPARSSKRKRTKHKTFLGGKKKRKKKKKSRGKIG